MITHNIKKYEETTPTYYGYQGGYRPNGVQWPNAPSRHMTGYEYDPPAPTRAVVTRPAVTTSELALSGTDRSNVMGKLEYAMFLNNLGIKQGDLVVQIFAYAPYHPRQVYQVRSIDEIHHHVQWGPLGVGPLCLNLHSCIDGVTMHKGGARQFKKIEPVDYPVMWREYLAKQA